MMLGLVLGLGCGGAESDSDGPVVDPVPTDGDASYALVVTSADGAPRPGLRVELYLGTGGTRSLQTGENGRVSIPEIVGGSYGVEVFGPMVAAWTFQLADGEELVQEIAVPDPPEAVPLTGDAVDVGDGLVLAATEGDLVAPPFEAPADSLAAASVDLPFDAATGTVAGSWLLAPYNHALPRTLPVAFDLDESGPLEVWQPDVGSASWRSVGTVDGAGGARLSGDAALIATVPVVLVRP